MTFPIRIMARLPSAHAVHPRALLRPDLPTLFNSQYSVSVRFCPPIRTAFQRYPKRRRRTTLPRLAPSNNNVMLFSFARTIIRDEIHKRAC
jgi:hypothetical protein